MMGVIIVIRILVLLIVLVLKMVEEGQKIRARPSPPFLGNGRKKTFFSCEVFPYWERIFRFSIRRWRPWKLIIGPLKFWEISSSPLLTIHNFVTSHRIFGHISWTDVNLVFIVVGFIFVAPPKNISEIQICSVVVEKEPPLACVHFWAFCSAARTLPAICQFGEDGAISIPTLPVSHIKAEEAFKEGAGRRTFLQCPPWVRSLPPTIQPTNSAGSGLKNIISQQIGHSIYIYKSSSASLVIIIFSFRF